MQDFISQTHSIETMKNLIERVVIRDLLKEYSDVDYFNKENLIAVLLDIYAQKKEKFIFIIDEWDCIFRELKEQKELQREYLDYLRNLLKDKEYVALAYMTGILPIKKYGTHSALNMFDEFSMTNAGELAKYTGFTEEEVKKLCVRYNMDFNEIERWYDGYELRPNLHIYNPKSVVNNCGVRRGTELIDTLWNVKSSKDISTISPAFELIDTLWKMYLNVFLKAKICSKKILATQ